MSLIDFFMFQNEILCLQVFRQHKIFFLMTLIGLFSDVLSTHNNLSLDTLLYPLIPLFFAICFNYFFKICF